MSGTSGHAAAKSALRREIRAARRRRLADDPGGDRRGADAAALADALLAAVPLPEGAHVAGYESLTTEPPTEALAEQLAADGIPMLVPVLQDDLDLDWRLAGAPGRRLGLDALGRAALVVVPALAVDRSGTRLGQGGGSYDRALARRGPGALVVAFVHDEELVDELPRDDHDQRVDAVATTSGRFVRLTPAARA